MTGFGRAEGAVSETDFVVEARTTNGRHLDVRVRVPRELASFEADARGAAAPCFGRGQVDVSVRFAGSAGHAAAVEVDAETASRYVEATRDLAQRFQLDETLSLGALLALPGVVQERPPPRFDAAALARITELVSEACTRAAEMRQTEGVALERELDARLERLIKVVGEIESRSDEVKRGLRARLERRIASLDAGVELDPGRLEQEVVYYAERMDVTEELVRMRSHADQFRAALAADGPVGRKLEFLLQEFGREVNTIGSKAGDAPIAHLVVELKTELEKMREQVLNVE